MDITKQFDIFSGSRVVVSISDQVDSEASFFDPSFTEVANLAKFPSLKLSNNVETLEVFDDEYSAKLSGIKKLEDTTLVLHRVIDDPHQNMLMKAVENKTLLRFRLFYVIDSANALTSTGYYQIFDAYVTAHNTRSGDNQVANIEYKISPDDGILAQGVAQEGEILRRGDWGIGCGADGFNGSFDSEILSGNRFVTYKGSASSNPFSTDTALLHLQPNENGGWQMTCNTSGDPHLRVRTVQKDGSSSWVKVYSTVEKPTPAEIEAVSIHDRIDFGEF
ncbi:hypothetical protein [Providencia sp. JUb39]|uniref:hypothetical protein n=1 Tax=Providencia sp. JUb39 TaxID=2724165 RepID=UPI00164E7835|nr:hypothetical protein [Providencia sp. JUb39]MBC5790611.1 hypothetical protein [Providencia sp. JUb39]